MSEPVPARSSSPPDSVPDLDPRICESPSHRAARTPAERRSMEGTSSPNPTMSAIPKHILDIWVIVLIILATILVMTSMVLCPAMAVIIYRVRTHPIRNGVVPLSSTSAPTKEHRRIRPNTGKSLTLGQEILRQAGAMGGQASGAGTAIALPRQTSPAHSMAGPG
ncbi:unnamed protein product [Caretta caretta]